MHFYHEKHFRCFFIIKKNISDAFYNKNHYQCIFIVKIIDQGIFTVKIISNAFLWIQSLVKSFYSKNNFQFIFIITIISNAFL